MRRFFRNAFFGVRYFWAPLLLLGCGEPGLPIAGIDSDAGHIKHQPTPIPALPIGEFLAMGSSDVTILKDVNLVNKTSNKHQVTSIDIEVFVGNNIAYAPEAVSDLRIIFGNVLFGRVLQISNEEMHDGYFKVRIPASTPFNRVRSSGESFRLDINVEPWSKIEGTQKHTRTHQINVQARAVGFSYKIFGETEERYEYLSAPSGPVFSLVRSCVQINRAEERDVPDGYSTGVVGDLVVPGAFTVTAVSPADDQSAVLESLEMFWDIQGVVPIATNQLLPWLFYVVPTVAPQEPAVFGSGFSPVIKAANDYTGSFEFFPRNSKDSGRRGIPLPPRNMRFTLVSAYKTQKIFAVDSRVSQSSLQVSIKGCTWNDGTRESLPCKPVPLSGEAITALRY